MSARTCWQTVILVMAAVLIVPSLGQSADTKNWTLSLTTTDADLSPDDRFLAITLVSPKPPKKVRKPIVESLELWDYRQNIKLASTELATYLNIRSTPNIVRFTQDGSLLVASEPRKVHILEATTLKSLRVIEPPLGPDLYIDAIETSPNGHIALIAANRNLFAYDLDSLRELFEWKSPHSILSISWKPDGTQFAVVAPFLCTRHRDTVHVFDTNPWRHVQLLKVRNPTSLAFSDDDLYIVESSFCKGSAFDRHLGLEVFETKGWSRRKTIFLPDRDIHSWVSFENGRLLADTGKVETVHDWLDGTTTGWDVDARFTIWAASAGSIAYTSPPLTVSCLGRVCMRLSRTGKMVLLNPRRPQLFSIP